jgi:hypothetical protein
MTQTWARSCQPAGIGWYSAGIMLGAFMIARAVGVLGFGFVGDGLLLAGIRRRGAGAGLLTWHGRKDLGRIWIALMAGVHFLPLAPLLRYPLLTRSSRLSSSWRLPPCPLPSTLTPGKRRQRRRRGNDTADGRDVLAC